VRVELVEVGETYLVHIPRRDLPYRFHTPSRGSRVSTWLCTGLAVSRHNDFALTVTWRGRSPS
jgi:hypothetical protein